MKTKLFPACYIEMPTSAEGKRAAFYLAAEEYIAKNFPKDNYLFSWQVSPTVVMGRNQIAHLELDLDYCRHNGIDIIRRKSGGGSIYADEENIMLSLITGPGAVEPIFEAYAKNVAACLRQMGAPATVSGRNDILLEGGGKICGNAFYHLNDRNIVHGTMLYGTNFEAMSQALTPDKAKLQSKGVTSVKSRVSILKDVLPLSLPTLRQCLRQQLTDRCIRLTEDDVQTIKAIEADYYDPIYLFGKSQHTDTTLQGHIDGCGMITFQFSLKGTLIDNVRLKGDFFTLEDASLAFRSAWSGVEFTPTHLIAALHERHPERSIRGLTVEQLSALITQEFPK